MNATKTTICYENRNGLVFACDTATGLIVNPRGEDLRPLLCKHEEFTPEEVREELERRGITAVLVYTGRAASWVDGQIRSRQDRVYKFAHMASQSTRCPGVWASVPVARIGDGSDWSDVYASR